jgi:hydrogenase maturation protease
VRSGQEPGKIHRFAAHAHELPAAHFSCSTHGFGPAQAVELGRALGRLPRRLIAYGIEAGDLQVGNGLSPEVARAAGEVAGRIAAECAAFERG